MRKPTTLKPHKGLFFSPQLGVTDGYRCKSLAVVSHGEVSLAIFIACNHDGASRSDFEDPRGEASEESSYALSGKNLSGDGQVGSGT